MSIRRPSPDRSSGMRGERMLSVVQVAACLGTSERFPRRLIAERRIRYVKLGSHVRIPESALVEFIAAGTVEPITLDRARRGAA